jgi:hypothetical protein
MTESDTENYVSDIVSINGLTDAENCISDIVSANALTQTLKIIC